MDATTVAIDLTQDMFEVALANRAGRIIERKRLTRCWLALRPSGDQSIMYGEVFLAIISNSASVRGSRLNAAQPASGYVTGLAAASEPYNTRSTPI